jgi:predicted Holliday junction resolvase-like endonuclease
MDEKTELLHYRISSGEKEMQEKLDTRAEVILQELKQMREESAKQHEALNSRIVILERWMWVVLGAFAVLEIFSFDLSSLM